MSAAKPHGAAPAPHRAHESNAALSARFSAGAPDHRGAGRAAVGRGLRVAIDARCKPGQVAPRACELVLRDVRARPSMPRLRAVRPGVPRALQFVLQRRWRQASAAAARAHLAAGSRDASSRIARTSIARCTGSVARAQLPPAARALIELGLNHEQQHQELILTDVKHLFSRNPAQARLPRDGGRWRRCSRSRCMAWSYDAGLATFGHAGDGFAFDNEDAARIASSCPASSSRRDRSRTANSPNSSPTAATGGPNCGCRSAGTRSVARGWHAPLYWERDGDAWRHVHAARDRRHRLRTRPCAT